MNATAQSSIPSGLPGVVNLWNRFKGGLTFRLQVGLCVVTSVLIIGFGYYDYSSAQKDWNYQLTELVDRVSLRIATASAGPLWSINMQQVVETIKSEMSDENLLAVEVRELREDKGGVFVTMTRQHDGTVSLTQKFESRSPISRMRMISYEGHDIGTATVHVTNAGMKRQMQTIFRQILIRIIVVNVISLAIIWLIMSRSRRIEEENNELRRHLQNIFNSMPSSLLAMDSHAIVTQMNRQAELMLGNTLDDSKGEPVADVLTIFPQAVPLIEEAAKTGQALQHRLEKTDDKGVLTHYEIHVFPLENALGCVVRLDDVSMRVRIEEMMIQNEKMNSVGMLAAGMAHEINNPLAIIAQACQNIERRLSDSLPKNKEVAELLGVDLLQLNRYLTDRQIYTFLENIKNAAARASNIVQDMLAYSRKSESRFAPCDVSELVDHAIRLSEGHYDLKKKYDFKHIEIERRYDTSVPPVACDKTKIEQVLINIIENAAMALMQSASVRPPRITISTKGAEGVVRIEIRDNGPGMDETIRKRIFEPFFTTKPVGVGTGLGLSVAYFIVKEQHKGNIEVESTIDVGTRFLIELPIDPRKVGSP